MRSSRSIKSNIGKFVVHFGPYIFSLLLISVLQSTVAFPQQNSWTNTGGPYKGYPISIAAGSGGLVYVATQSGIYRSTDHGLTWSVLPPNPWTAHLSAVHSSSGNILVGPSGSLFMRTDDSLVYRSTDNGDTWSSLESSLSYTPVRFLVASSAGDIFALVDTMGILRSSDLGEHWSPIYAHVPISHVYSLLVDSTRLMIMRTDTCCYRSTDNGYSWLLCGAGGGDLLAIAPDRTLFSAVIIPQFWMIGPYSNVGLVFRSTDDGGHWTACVSIKTDRNLITISWHTGLTVSSSGSVYYTSTDSVYRSTDSGENWSAIPWNQMHLQDYSGALCSDGENNVYVGTQQCGLFRLRGEDTTCNLIPAGFSSVMVKTIATKSSGVIFTTVDSGVFRSTNNGQAWQKVLSGFGISYPSITAQIDSHGTIFAINQRQAGSGFLYRSTDNGAHWDSLGEHGSVLGISPGDILFQGYTHSASPIYRSTDDGDTWTQVPGIDTVGNLLYPLCFAFSPAGNLFAGSLASMVGVERSIDSGNTWVSFHEGLPSAGQTQGQDGGVRILGINSAGTIFAATDSGLYRSTNNGESWSEIDHGLPLTIRYYQYNPVTGGIYPLYILPEVNAIACNSAGHVYIGYGRGVFYSTNNGDTWIPFTQDETMNISMTALAFDQQGYLYGGRGGTIYRSSSSTTSVSKLPVNVAGQWRLEQNYPNPFNPTTTISFTIPAALGSQASIFVSLKIYDILGREVATLVSEKLSAGSYRRQWDAKTFSSGVYFYRMEAGSYSETKKLALVK